MCVCVRARVAIMLYEHAGVSIVQEKLLVAQLLHRFSFHYHVYGSSKLDPILIQLHRIHFFTRYLLRFTKFSRHKQLPSSLTYYMHCLADLALAKYPYNV